MQCDGDKIRRLREAAMMTQEKLASMSNVKERTIQRAEAGANLRAETISQIASALNTPARDLWVQAPSGSQESEVTEPNEPDKVVLRPTISGRDVIKLCTESYDAEIDVDVEPTRDNVEILTVFADSIGKIAPDPMPPFGRDERNEGDVATRLASRLRVNTPTAVEAAGDTIWIGERGAGKADSIPMPK